MEPLIANPLAVKSFADFWGDRWNHKFSDAAYRLLTAPMMQRFGHAPGLLAAFGF